MANGMAIVKQIRSNKFTHDEIIAILREARPGSWAPVARKYGVSVSTLKRWHSEALAEGVVLRSEPERARVARTSVATARRRATGRRGTSSRTEPEHAVTILSVSKTVLVALALLCSLGVGVLLAKLTPNEARVPGNRFAGSYSGTYHVDDGAVPPWRGTVRLSVGADGSITGYVWLPTNDGGPGLVSDVTGEAKPDGTVSLSSNHAAAGTEDGQKEGEGVDGFQFSHSGQIEERDGQAVLSTSGQGNQGCSESLMAQKS